MQRLEAGRKDYSRSDFFSTRVHSNRQKSGYCVHSMHRQSKSKRLPEVSLPVTLKQTGHGETPLELHDTLAT